MGYRLNHLDEPVFMAVSKPLLIEFGIHHKLESCGVYFYKNQIEIKKNLVIGHTWFLCLADFWVPS